MRSPHGLMHPDLLRMVASVGHGDVIVLADAGLRIPGGVPVLDLRLVAGVPNMVQVLGAVADELVVESVMVATEWAEWNPVRRFEVLSGVPALRGLPVVDRSHDELMADVAPRAHCYVRTAECSAYSSVCLVAGVSYFDAAVAIRTQVCTGTSPDGGLT